MPSFRNVGTTTKLSLKSALGPLTAYGKKRNITPIVV